MRDRKTLATALRKFADYIERDEKLDVSELQGAMNDIAEVVDLLEAEDDEWAREAQRDWHAREAQGEKAIPSAEVRRILGL